MFEYKIEYYYYDIQKIRKYFSFPEDIINDTFTKKNNVVIQVYIISIEIKKI
jgi:hypothetical protein